MYEAKSSMWSPTADYYAKMWSAQAAQAAQRTTGWLRLRILRGDASRVPFHSLPILVLFRCDRAARSPAHGDAEVPRLGSWEIT